MNADTGSGFETTQCSQCGMTIHEGMDHQKTDDAVFCRPCFDKLSAELQHAVAAQSTDVNYAMGLVGGVLGGALGALVWWGFTIVTNIALGLVAVVIGIAVGKGVILLSGNKRHLNLQIMAVVISFLSFVYASFLVNRSFIQAALEAEGTPFEIPLLPSTEMFLEVVKAGFSPIDLLFLGIVIYQAWKIPAPLAIQQQG